LELASENVIGGSAIVRSWMVITGLVERLCIDEFNLVPLRGSMVISLLCNAFEYPVSAGVPSTMSLVILFGGSNSACFADGEFFEFSSGGLLRKSAA